MLTLGPLAFANAAALWALLTLPLIWWLLRLTPPRPERVSLRPVRFLLDLVSKEETPHKTPWWLMLLRIALVALVIIALARPQLVPEVTAEVSGDGPVLVIIDDGWASATRWHSMANAATGILDKAAEAGRTVVLATTTRRSSPQTLEPQPADEAARDVAALSPQALEPDRMSLASRLKDSMISTEARLEIIWLSDGLDYGEADTFAEQLGTLANGSARVTVYLPSAHDIPVALGTPEQSGNGLHFSIARAGDSASEAREVVVRALAANGRNLGEVRVEFAAGENYATGELRAPLQIRNEIARLEIAGSRSAGSVFLVDDRWRRKTIGLVGGGPAGQAQPLLDQLYYVDRALEPYAERIRTDEGTSSAQALQLTEHGVSMLVLADVGSLNPDDARAIHAWIERGGVLVRFAGPRLSGGRDDLLPVSLRGGDRALDGALTWSEPQSIAPFSEESPFAGLEVPEGVSVTKQVLAEPRGDLTDRTWARLADGTPLVTGAPYGNGHIVLFHVTANADWSNLPLSGLFVQMLQRVLDLAPIAGAAEMAITERDSARAGAAFVPVRTMDGFGDLGEPPGHAQPVPASAIDTAQPSAAHPAGFYRRGGEERALNISVLDPRLQTIQALPGNVTVAGYTPGTAVSLAGPILATAFGFLLADFLIVLAISGSIASLRSRFAATAPLVVLALASFAHQGTLAAQEDFSQEEQFAMMATFDTRLAYVLTGNERVDNISRAGLEGLNQALIRRTAVEPASPIGVDVERDEVLFFPLLYWPVLADAEPLGQEALARVDMFLKTGGTILFDTRDHQTALPGIDSAGTSALRRLIGPLDIPPLEPVPPDHVLTKAFYLLQTFPGRYAGGDLWVEVADAGIPQDSANYDRVSTVIIGSNDYAAAWAIDAGGQPKFATTPGGNRQRELAYRTGINIVMYALTGNYKADQVHVPALLERLGQ